MKIYLRELTDNETELDFDESETWVADAVAAADEKLETEPTRRTPPGAAPRGISTHLSLRKVDDVVVLNGDLRTQVRLVCSRCANPVSFPVDSHFSALFCQDPSMAGVAHLQPGRHKDAPATVAGRNKGHARHAHDETIGTDQDLDITYIAEDHINLASVLTEQLMLQLPFQPLCREDCKGICANCGADLNKSRCPCAKLAKNNPFAVLKDFKV